MEIFMLLIKVPFHITFLNEKTISKKINNYFFYITHIIRTCKEFIYILDTDDNNRNNDDELTLLSNNN